MAAESTKSGVLFHGMAGAAIVTVTELAYHREAAGRFRACLVSRARGGRDIAPAQRDFAVQRGNPGHHGT